MEYSRDEVRRQLIASRADHAASMRPWREALLRVFGTENDIPASARAQMLGVPSRRGFLKVGGATVLGAAVLAACTGTGEVAESGSASNLTTTTADPAETELDVQLLRTATSLEILAVNTYQAAIDSGLVTTADVADAATLFRDQHDDHRAALQETTTAITQDATLEYTAANSFLQENVIDPALADLTDEAGVIQLALTIESAAAETYAWATGQFSTATLRQAIMGIGGVEARHMAVLRGFIEEDQVPVAFLPTDDRIPEDALIANDDVPADTSGGGGTTTTTAGDTTTTTGPQTTTSVAGATTTTAVA